MDILKVKKKKIAGKSKIEFTVGVQTFVLDVDYENRKHLKWFKDVLTAAFDKYTSLKFTSYKNTFYELIEFKIDSCTDVNELIELNKELNQLQFKSSAQILKLQNES